MIKFFGLALIAFAMSATASGSDLKQNMKQAGTLFKGIGASLNDKAKNPENAKSAGDMIDFFKLTLLQIPDHLNEIPEARRAEALKGYQDQIQQCIDLSLALQQAFLSNENSTAANIYKELKDLKQEGHDQYDP